MHTHHAHSGSKFHWNKGIGVSTLFHVILICGFAMIIDQRAETLSQRPPPHSNTLGGPSKDRSTSLA